MKIKIYEKYLWKIKIYENLLNLWKFITYISVEDKNLWKFITYISVEDKNLWIFITYISVEDKCKKKKKTKQNESIRVSYRLNSKTAQVPIRNTKCDTTGRDKKRYKYKYYWMNRNTKWDTTTNIIEWTEIRNEIRLQIQNRGKRKMEFLMLCFESFSPKTYTKIRKDYYSQIQTLFELQSLVEKSVTRLILRDWN